MCITDVTDAGSVHTLCYKIEIWCFLSAPGPKTWTVPHSEAHTRLSVDSLSSHCTAFSFPVLQSRSSMIVQELLIFLTSSIRAVLLTYTAHMPPVSPVLQFGIVKPLGCTFSYPFDFWFMDFGPVGYVLSSSYRNNVLLSLYPPNQFVMPFSFN